MNLDNVEVDLLQESLMLALTSYKFMPSDRKAWDDKHDKIKILQEKLDQMRTPNQKP